MFARMVSIATFRFHAFGDWSCNFIEGIRFRPLHKLCDNLVTLHLFASLVVLINVETAKDQSNTDDNNCKCFALFDHMN